MVVFLDLDEDDVSERDPHADPNEPAGFAASSRQQRQRFKPAAAVRIGNSTKSLVEEEEERPNPNLNGFSAALGCYPYVLAPPPPTSPWQSNTNPSIVTQITQYIDHNTLHSLSRTCRQIRANLLQYRTRLVQQTLHCENEAQNASLAALNPAGQKWHILGEAGHLVSGKVGRCARDLVSDCRRCGRIVCRVCPPPTPPHPSSSTRTTPNHRPTKPNLLTHTS